MRAEHDVTDECKDRITDEIKALLQASSIRPANLQVAVKGVYDLYDDIMRFSVNVTFEK